MAAAKLVEIKCRICGLMIEELHIRHEQIDLVGALAEARRRVFDITPSPAALVSTPLDPFNDGLRRKSRDVLEWCAHGERRRVSRCGWPARAYILQREDSARTAMRVARLISLRPCAEAIKKLVGSGSTSREVSP